LTLRKAILLNTLAAFLLSATNLAWAQNGTNAPTLDLSATLTTAVRLTISTSSSPAGLSVTPSGNATSYQLASFGNIDGIGLSTPAAGVNLLTGANASSYCTTPGAAWITPIKLNAQWTGSNSASGNIAIGQSGLALGGATQVTMAESTDGSLGNLTQVTTTGTTIFSSVSKNVNTTDYVGWLVCGDSTYSNGLGITGQLTYTLTVP
jgi:hypothetical protein